MIITLDQKERDKFAAFCEQEAKSSEEMAKQLEKLNLGNMEDAMIKKFRLEQIAYEVVGHQLRDTEESTI